MKVLITVFLLFFFVEPFFSQSRKKHFELNGYVQFRLYKNDDNSQGFMVRRAKLWIKGNVPKCSRFHYKLMGIFKYNNTGYFGLLDVYGEYYFKSGYIRFGQQIPEFSLQRLQPDWKIPLTERAEVIDALIPAAQSSARDIGMQLHFEPVKNWQISAGIFNGNGSNIKIHQSSNYLYSMKTGVKFNFGYSYTAYLGISAMYRRANKIKLSKIFGNDIAFSGNDFRFGIESSLTINTLRLQAEYLEAHLGLNKASGYYVYANYNFTDKNQFVIGVEKFKDLNEKTKDDNWLVVGFNHKFVSDMLKLIVNGKTQFNKNYALTVQMQIFFN